MSYKIEAPGIQTTTAEPPSVEGVQDSPLNPISVLRREHMVLLNSLAQELPPHTRVVNITELKKGSVVTISLEVQRLPAQAAGSIQNIDKDDSQPHPTNLEDRLRTVVGESLEDANFELTNFSVIKESPDTIHKLVLDVKAKNEGAIRLSTELVENAINGDTDAFGELYRLAYEQIRRYIYSALYRADAKEKLELAEDLTQDTFERAWKARSNFVHFRNIPYEAYLFRIAHNSLMGTLRKREYGTPNISIEYNNIDIVDKRGFTDNIELILAASMIRDLPTSQQQVLTLALLGYNNIEAAFLLGKTANNIKVSTHKGRIRLRGTNKKRRVNSSNQIYTIAIADHLVRTRRLNKRPYANGAQLRHGLVISLIKRLHLPASEVQPALEALPSGFLDRLVAIK